MFVSILLHSSNEHSDKINMLGRLFDGSIRRVLQKCFPMVGQLKTNMMVDSIFMYFGTLPGLLVILRETLKGITTNGTLSVTCIESIIVVRRGAHAEASSSKA